MMKSLDSLRLLKRWVFNPPLFLIFAHQLLERMKNLSLILSALALVLTGVLFYFHFQSNKANQDVLSSTDIKPSDSKTLYVSMDSIISGYLFYKDLEAKFVADNKVRQDKLLAKEATFKRMYNDYQEKVMTMTTRERSIKEEEIGAYQQQLMQEQQELSQLAAVQESQMMSQLYDTLYVFFEKFAAKKNVDLILTYQKGDNILFSNKKADCTIEALQLMNESYKKSVVDKK